MTKKGIERTVIIIIAAVVLVALVMIPVGSYIYYRATLPHIDRVTTVLVESEADLSVPSGLTADELNEYASSVKDSLVVTAVYESGRELIVAGSSYEVSFDNAPRGDERTCADKIYPMRVTLDVAYEAVGTLDVFGQPRIEAEESTIVGGRAQTENGVGMAGAFDAITTNASDNYVEFKVWVSEATSADLRMRAANGNLKGDTSDGGSAWMDELSLSAVGRLTVNGESVAIPSSAVIPGSDAVTGSWASLYAIFYDVDICGINLGAGENTVRFSIIDSGDPDYDNAWNSPAGMNIDYFEVLPNAAPEGETPERLALSGIASETEIEPGQPFDDVFSSGGRIAAVYGEGRIRYVGDDELTVTSAPATASGRAQPGGRYTLTATLDGTNASASVTAYADGTVTADTSYSVSVVGGSVTTENGRTFAGSFNTNNKPVNSVTFGIYMDGAATVDLVLSVSNGYLTIAREDGDTTYYKMSALPLDDILDVSINGTDADISGITLPESAENTNSTSLYGNFVDVTIEAVELKEGENTVELSLHRSESGLQTCWENRNEDGDAGDDLPNESPVINVESLETVFAGTADAE